MALVIVLFAVALVSIVVLAYFNLAILNRNISFSSAGQARANILALSSLNIIKGDFISEIQAASTQESDSTASGIPIYLPLTNSTMVPYRMTANITPVDSTIPANLVKWSSGTYPLWPATTAYNNQVGPTRAAAGISTGNASINGHLIGNSRWTKPAFNTSSTFPTKVVPEWVYMTRQGPLGLATTPIATLANSAASNPNYVVGRYAYAVYDEGGLLDVAAAGYSPTTFSSDPTDVGRKGNQGFADLTQLGLTTAQADQFVNWRNATTGSSAANYVNYLTTNAPASGFLQPAAGDQSFLSRQDLIQYWTSELGANSNMLPYLTSFSREKNAPSWGPEHNANDPNSSTYWNGTNVTIDPINNPIVSGSGSISYAYHDNQNQASVTVGSSTQPVYNRFFPNVRVTSAFVRLSGEQALVGEPLVKNRFDLNKLSWITYQGVATGISPTDVYHYFGLTLNPDGSGSWIYNHSTILPPGSAVTQAQQIMTLDQIAAAGREPDFYELLQAVILQGSLGLLSGDPTHANDDTISGSGGEYYRAYEGSSVSYPYEAPFARSDKDMTSTHLSLFYALEKYQVIQIGTNIIDQYTTDNFPTDIMLNGEHIYGIKNLPYLNAIGDTVLRPAPGTISSPPDATFNDPYQQYLQHWLTFSLWNPHQNAAFPPSNGPVKLRIAVTSGEEYPTNNHLAAYSTAGSYIGRIFEPEITSGSVTTIKSHTTPTSMDGPAWIGIYLNNYPNHFSEPTAIGYSSSLSFTQDSDNTSATNMNDTYGRISSSKGWQKAGIYLGWSKSPDNPYKVPLCANLPGYANWATSQKGIPALGTDLPGLANLNPFTIELQYEDTSIAGPAHWHTYQIYRGVVPSRGSGSGDAFMETTDTAWTSWTAVPPNNYNVTTNPNGYSNPNSYTVTQLVTGAGPLAANQDYWVNNILDPRTGRLNTQVIHTGSVQQLEVNMGSSTLVFPGADAGNPPYGHFPKAGLGKNASDSPNNWPNNQSTTVSYYLDRDFIKRVGDAAGWAGASPWTAGAQAQRPLRLDRPFRSVAELGYVFRDDAWKTLNFISANSADSGLLDIFYIGSSPSTAKNLPPPDVIAARMNINSAALNSLASASTASIPLQSQISAGLRDYLSTDPTTISSSISAADAGTLASSIIAYVKASGPLMNIGDISSVFPQDTSVTTANPGLKGQREALTRALADSSDTRTWNLMIDVVAQAGKLNPTAANLNNFTVEGEKHYWLHVAIDRFTGEIVDQQLEPVWE